MKTQELFPTVSCGSVQDISLACAEQHFTLFIAEGVQLPAFTQGLAVADDKSVPTQN